MNQQGETELYLDKYRRKDDFDFELPDGCCYDNVENLIVVGIMGFCGCGMPEESMKYLRDSLQLIDDLSNLDHNNHDKEYDKWDKKKSEFFKSDGQEYFTWFVLDEKGLTEHGGSVPGWLTEEGQELLHDLNKILDQ